MRKNFRTKMLALIMAMAMLLCVFPMAAVADENPETVTAQAPQATVMQKLVLNDLMDTSYSLWTTGGTEVNLSTADRSQDYDLIINVNQTPNIQLPAKGTFYYQLPEEIKSANDGTYGNVTWTYVAEDNQLVLQFTPDVEGNQEAFSVKVRVRLGNVYDLYNIAKIGSLYYRMDKTKIETKKNMYEYIVNKTKGVDNKVDSSEYTATEYNFGDITLGGVTYVYRPLDFVPDETETINYYTANLQYVTAVIGKIGGMKDNTNPRWLSDIEYYKDGNETDSFHRNYEIKTYKHKATKLKKVEQTLYNFLGVTNNAVHSKNYFRLNPTKIIAALPENFSNNYHPASGDYTLIPDEEYDFTDVVLTIDGEEYEYRKSAPNNGELYENYYTVVPDGVRVKLTMHESGGQTWLDDPTGYLDGSENTFGVTDNNVVSYHRDYKATIKEGNLKRIDLYDGENKVDVIRSAKNSTPELPILTKDGFTFVGWKDADGNEYNPKTRLTKNLKLYAQWQENVEAGEQKITYSSSLEGYEIVFVGTEVTLTAHIEGYAEPYNIQWMYTDNPEDLENGTLIPGETNKDYTFILNAENCEYEYYVVVTPAE